MKKTVIYALFLSLGVVIGLSLSLVIPHRSHREGPWEKRMNLSESEKSTIKKIFKEDREQVKELMDKMEQSSRELKNALGDKNSSDEELKQKFKKFNLQRQELTDRRFEINLQIRKIVGPERMKAFDVLGPLPRPRGERPPRGPKGKNGPMMPREAPPSPEDDKE